MAQIKDFQELETWKMAREICIAIEALFVKTPLGRRFALRDQMDRSSGSIMDNIAEGFGRGGNREFRNFLGYAKGSCKELQSQLIRAKGKELINEDQYAEVFELCDSTAAKLGAFIKYLSKTEYRGTKFKK